MTSQNRQRFFLIIVVICILPLCLNTLGFDFSSTHTEFTANNIDNDILFKVLAGSLHHVLLEWSAVCIAIMAALTSLLHYKIKKDLAIPILGMALLCVGFVDAFHTLAATRIIEANTNNTDFIPFTWALSRIFNASIMLIGTAISLWLTYQYALKHKIKQPINILVFIGFIFIITSYFIVHFAANTTHLPQTMFPGAIISRPFDILPLGLFIVSGALFWLWFNIEKSDIKFALILSIIPEVATQLYMILGSTALFDNGFNIAHALKIVAYSTILIGIVFDLTQSAKARIIAPVLTEKKTLASTDNTNLLTVGDIKTPLTLKLPAVTFFISLLLTVSISYSFFADTNKIIKQAEAQELTDATELLKPMLGQFNQRLINEINYLIEDEKVKHYVNQVDPINGAVSHILKSSLKRNFNYTEIKLTSFNSTKKQHLVISKTQESAYDEPEFVQFMQKIDTTTEKTLAANTLLLFQNQTIYYPEITTEESKNNDSSQLKILAPIRDTESNLAIGYMSISLNFTRLFNQEIAGNLPLLKLFIANKTSHIVITPLNHKHNITDKNQVLKLTTLAPEIINLQQQGASQGIVNIVQDKVKTPAFYRQINLAAYGYPHPLQLLVYLSHSKTSERLATTRTNSLLLGGLLALISLAIAIVMARQVTKPLEEITDAVQDTNFKTALSALPIALKGEIGVLARSFYNLIIKTELSLQEQKNAIEEASIASKKLGAIINTAADAILTLNNHNLIISANPASERIFDLTIQELINLPINLIIPDGISNTDHLNANEESAYFITQGKKKLRKRFAVEVSVSINPNDHTKILIVRDISKQVKQEEELAEARKYVDKITSSVPIMLAYVGSDLTYKFVNLNFERWYQKPLDSFINKNIFTSLSNHAHTHMEHYIDNVLAGKTVSFEDTQLCQGLGGKRHLRTTYTPDFNHGKVQGFYISIEDISELKHTSRQLELTSSRLEIALSAPEIGVWEFYIPDRQLLWDDRMYQLFGTRAATYANVYDAWYSAIHPDDKEDILGVMKHSISSGDDINTEFRVIWPTGEVRNIEAHAKVLRNNQGEPERLIGTNMDITEHKKLIAEKENALQKAKETTKLKSEFLASMSHEIRTPMNGVLGMLNLLQQSELNSEQDHFATLAKSSAESLLIIINDILDFSKIEAGKLDFESIEFSLHQLLSEFIESVAAKAEEKQLELILDVTNVENIPVIGDPGRIRQILTNLVGNALKFTKQGEIVIKGTLTTNQDNSLTFICDVTDTGVGIPPEKSDHIFDSFTQVDASTTRQFGGTGLGLAIVQQLCSLMNGEIKLQSKVNKGSTFTFSIQLTPSDSTQITMPPVDLTHANVLIVDDNKTNLEVLSKQLHIWGANTLTAGDAFEALHILEQTTQNNLQPIDVAILDMQMPNMNGAELGTKIRQNTKYDHIKLIMMTSMGRRGDANVLAQIGFSAYFPKPTTNQDLYSALSIVLEGGEALQQATPLVTQHYVKRIANPPLSSPSVDNDINNQSDLTQQNTWPENTKLLLVEDNFINQTVAQAQLKNIGLSCDIAGNGEEAIQRLTGSDQPYTIILMDCQMPEMDGYEATNKIRNGLGGKHYINIPIIALTANAMKGDKEKCLAAGMDDYLTKPLKEPLLEDMLQQWLT
ncbi:response regulator [Algibacillus agarilyticus]|uniref:response regulator n=1 Tax=Algibacillus agarilyticus TaxID=2234133 RepID=UPI000DD025F2|nr:response regulator [Algibacillus agarilyticus]